MNNMSYLSFLKRTKLPSETRWIIKTKPNGKVREVKHLFDPGDYTNGDNPRIVHDQETVIAILEANKID
jgi:hypothetical protein